MTDATGAPQSIPRHPATYSQSILTRLSELIPDGVWLDPFIGTGKLYGLETPARKFVGIELEPEWAAADPRTIVGDAHEVMQEWTGFARRFDGVVTSPVYGNRMSDHHNAADASSRRSYTHDLGRTLRENNAGNLYFWQPKYKAFHVVTWQLCHQVTNPGGAMFLNVSNFIRNGEIVRVVGWHMKTLQSVGYTIVKVHPVETPRMRHGENHDARVDCEFIIEARKP